MSRLPRWLFSTSPKRLAPPLRRVAAVGLLLLSGGLLACGDDGDSGPTTSSGQSGSAGTAGATGVGGAGGGGEGGSGGQGGCSDSLPLPEEVPELLSETGLYADINSKQLNAAVLPFAPQYQLWSDSAEKQRWVYLPECDVIDTSDMNDWVLPVGTRLWKEFALNGVRIETRLIMRTGPGANDFEYTTYLWNSDETEATRTSVAVLDAKGTTHDVPGEAACRQCHGSHAKGGGRPSRALGLSALQLSGDGASLSLKALADAGKLSAPPPVDRYPTVGADATEQAALGYLHANCGHCHNHTADGVPQIDMNLWIDVEAGSAAETGAYMTAVGVANAIFNDPHVSARIEPGNPQASAVWYRMNQRGNNGQMPPIASEFVDPVGAAAVEAWIGSLQ